MVTSIRRKNGKDDVRAASPGRDGTSPVTGAKEDGIVDVAKAEKNGKRDGDAARKVKRAAVTEIEALDAISEFVFQGLKNYSTFCVNFQR